MMYPEALLHPEVKLLDEGFCLLILTLAQCSSIQQSALVTKLSETLSLDEVNLLTLRVISILSVCASQGLSGSYFTWRCSFTDAWGYSILSACVSLSPTGSILTWRSELTDSWGDIYLISLRQSKFNRKLFYLMLHFHWRLRLFYFISLRQSKSNRKHFHFRLNLNLVLRLCT